MRVMTLADQYGELQCGTRLAERPDLLMPPFPQPCNPIQLQAVYNAQ